MGRRGPEPKYTAKIGILVEPEKKKQFYELCNRLGHNPSTVLRAMIDQMIIEDLMGILEFDISISEKG